MWVRYDLILGKLRESDGGSVLPGTTAVLFTWAGDPNGVVTPTKGGDQYLNTTTGGLWISSNATNTSWKEYNFTTDL
jgi:hypothetical protein